MVKRENVNSFLSCSGIAVAGVSRTGRKFGNSAFNELKKKGYSVYPVNPNAREINGELCYQDVKSIPEKVEGILIVLPPQETMNVLKEAVAANIKNVWLQQGAESPEAIEFCSANGLNTVYGQCILMFAEPAQFFHKAHRWVMGITGKLPK